MSSAPASAKAVSDTVASCGLTRLIGVHGVEDLAVAIAEAWDRRQPGGLVLCNLVDSEQEYGCRRDVAGFAAAPEQFERLPSRLMAPLNQGGAR